jgi:hypothetical protein
MEVICSSETSVDTQRTTRCYIPEDATLHNHRCENLKSYTTRMSSWKGIHFLYTRSALFWILEEISVRCSSCWKPHSDIPHLFSTQIAHVGSLNLRRPSAAGMRHHLHLGRSTARLWHFSAFQAPVYTDIIMAHTTERTTEMKFWHFILKTYILPQFFVTTAE